MGKPAVWRVQAGLSEEEAREALFIDIAPPRSAGAMPPPDAQAPK